MNYTEPSVLFLDLGYKISPTSSWMNPVSGIFRTVQLHHPVNSREIQLSGCNVCTKQNSSLLFAEIIVHSFIVLIYQSGSVDPQGYMGMKGMKYDVKHRSREAKHTRWIYNYDWTFHIFFHCSPHWLKIHMLVFFVMSRHTWLLSWHTSKILSLSVGNQTICRWNYAEPSVSFPYLGYNVSSIRASKKWWLPWVRWLECMAREVWRNAPLENAWNSLGLQMSISCLRHTPGWCD